MNPKLSLPIFSCLLSLIAVPKADAVLAAYVHIHEVDPNNPEFHLAEVEAFAGGVLPNGLGGATSFSGGLTTSTNDIGPGLVAFGVGNVYPVLGTTNTIQHGIANQNPNNALETGADVWSTDGSTVGGGQYTLDLGGTFDVTTVRIYPRNEACCPERWGGVDAGDRLEIQLLDAARNPIAGTFSFFAGNGVNTAREFTFAPVPEPGSIMLLGLASSALLLRRRP